MKCYHTPNFAVTQPVFTHGENIGAELGFVGIAAALESPEGFPLVLACDPSVDLLSLAYPEDMRRGENRGAKKDSTQRLRGTESYFWRHGDFILASDTNLPG